MVACNLQQTMYIYVFGTQRFKTQKPCSDQLLAILQHYFITVYIYIYIYTYITILQSRQIMLQLLRLLVKHNSLESTVFFLLSKFSGISRDSKNILQTIEQLIKENFSGLFVFWTSRSKREIPQGLFDGYVYLTYRPVYLHINKIVALFDEMVSTNNV